MCGIGGIFFSSVDLVDNSIINSFERLKVRGPDNFSVERFDNKNLMVHSRLAIIDPYTSSNQPMQSMCRRYYIVFNGEIYNFQELKRFLIKKGVGVDNINSDTGILLEGFLKLGVDFISLLRGMFACSIYDSYKKINYVFRDQFGIKPLYYSYSPSYGLIFSSLHGVVSEISKSVGINLSGPNKSSIIESFIFRGPISPFLDSINEISPGVLYTFSKNNIIEQPINFDVIPSGTKEKSADIIKESVSSHLVSDTPVALLLSGGVDSSLLAQFCNTNDLVGSYTYKQNTSLDESHFADAVASQTNLVSNHVELDFNDIISWLSLIDIPITDPSAIPIFSISKKVRNDKIKVLLSGEGADEIFGGYKKYRLVFLINLLIKFRLKRFLILFFNKFKFRSIFVNGTDIYFTGSSSPIQVHDLFQLFKNSSDVTDVLKRRSFLIDGSKDIHIKLCEYEIKNRLNYDLLRRSDMATMASSVECRVPFVDKYVLELGKSLTFKDKFGFWGLDTKKTLRKLLSPSIKSIVNRPKTGFDLDLKLWFTKLSSICETYLLEKKIIFLNYSKIESLYNNYENLSSNDLYILWSWLVIESAVRNN